MEFSEDLPPEWNVPIVRSKPLKDYAEPRARRSPAVAGQQTGVSDLLGPAEDSCPGLTGKLSIGGSTLSLFKAGRKAHA